MKVILRAALPGTEEMINASWDSTLGIVERRAKGEFDFDFYVADIDQQCYLEFTFVSDAAAERFRKFGVKWLAEAGWKLQNVFLFDPGIAVPIRATKKFSR